LFIMFLFKLTLKVWISSPLPSTTRPYPVQILKGKG
jgi:hypothetical protein